MGGKAPRMSLPPLEDDDEVMTGQGPPLHPIPSETTQTKDMRVVDKEVAEKGQASAPEQAIDQQVKG
ncbi:unnamed protein product [Rhizoctonia solani]|uniref:Uncharacterized protein n=1 Tax=Rhizoctonia solani TaxID=456999 RepID=A0A8H3H3C8_9AGAM|nr:unnamed protein product [Rhizoctonia solani]